MSSSSPVAIFDADAPAAIAFLRSLGRAGIHTRLYSHKSWPVARFSRECRQFESCPDLEDANDFIDWLEDEVRSDRIAFIAPTSDAIAFFTALLNPIWSSRLRNRMPTPQKVFTCLLKDRFSEACRGLGFRVPFSVSPASVQEATDIAETLPYPVILKPKSHIGAGLIRGQVVRNAAELRHVFSPYAISHNVAFIVNRFPELALPIIQEYIPNALDNLYSISGILSPNGEVIAHAGNCKTSQWPARLGIGTRFESWAEEAPIARGLELVRTLLGRGLFELEMIRDEGTGTWLPIDLNPRAHGFISFDIARNNDLPLLWYRTMMGEQVPEQDPPRTDIDWIHGIPYHLNSWVSLIRGPSRARRVFQYMRHMSRAHVDVVNDTNDPFPSLALAGSLLSHPRSLLRSILEA